MTTFRLRLQATVARTYPHRPILRTRKNGEEVVSEHGPCEWYLQIGHISFRLDEEPPPNLQDRPATITIEVPLDD